MKNRHYQILLIVSTLAFCWLAMMAVHELGHVLNGWLGGARVSRVVLHPLAFSRTDFADDPHPLFTAWGGALGGVALPILLWAVFRRFCRRYSFLAAFFAGFCLIANGAYLAGGLLYPGGADDAGAILAHGGERWHVLFFSLPAAIAGFWFLNGLGPSFGLGKTPLPVDRTAAWAMTALVVLLIAVELAVS